jgi:hypothetical protein
MLRPKLIKYDALWHETVGVPCRSSKWGPSPALTLTMPRTQA